EYGVYLRLLGLLRLMQGKYPQAREIMGQSIQTFLALDSDMDGRYAINIAGAYNYMAETYRLEGQYQAAFHCYDQAIAYNRSRGYYPGAAVIYTNYGVAADQNGQRAEAKKLFQYAVDIYTDSHEYSGYPIALSYLALYDAQEGRYDRAAQQLRDALRLSETIASPWWKGITLYMSWKIRCLMEERGQKNEDLEAFWPALKEDHCRQCLSCLHQLQPRIETEEMERELKRITGEP
nr:tetratricopeptide repeat protein [Oscillospiraceae bacterium]